MLELIDLGVIVVANVVLFFILSRVFLSVLARRTIRGFMMGKKYHKASEQTRLDNKLAKALVDDFTAPNTPIGSIVNMVMPNVKQVLGTSPETIISLLEVSGRLAPAIQNIMPMLQGITNPQGKTDNARFGYPIES